MRINRYADTPPQEQPRPDVAVLGAKIIEKLPENAAPATQEPIVTVVTAVYNVIKDGRKEKMLQCLDSVQEQTCAAVEHLIIDGASSDGTLDLIKNYRNTKVPLRILSEPDAGIYDAMNRGLWLARGKYVIFLNSDDYYSDPSGLAESLKCLEDTDSDFSYAPICVLDEKTDQPVEHLLNHPDANLIFLEMPFSHQSVMARRDAMLEINGFDLRYSSGADYDSVLRLIFTGHRACFVPVSFVAFRLGGFSFIYVEQSQREVGAIFSRLYKKYLDVDLSPEEGTQIYLTKQGPKELRQRQFRFAKAAFGGVIGAVHKLNDDGDDENIPENMLALYSRLQALKSRPGLRRTLRIIARLLISSPILFGRFLLHFFLFRRTSDNAGAGKSAYHKLLAIERKKARKKLLAAEKDDHLSALLLPQLGVTYQDYWYVNGVYGICEGEPWGAWTGRKFSTFFNLPEDFINKPLTAEIHIGGFVLPQSPKRIVDIMINNRKIGSLTIENLLPQPHQFDIPADVATSDVLDIDFIIDQTVSPKSVGRGEDTRELGMTFRKLLIRKKDCTGEKLPADRLEIKVGFLNHFNKFWVGGITYFKNLFQAMDTTESPKLKPFIFRPKDELADCLLPYVSLLPVQPFPSSRNSGYLPTAADYKVDILSHLNDNQVSEGYDGIAWIADFQHMHLPEMFDRKEITFRNRSFHSLIDQNRIVCLSSYDAMNDFKKYAPESAYKARCLHFVSIPDPGLYPLPETEVAEIRRTRQLPERYFYVPNQFWKHKNHIAVLKAVSILQKSGLKVHVVFSGNTYDARFPHYFEELEAFCKQEQIKENVHFLGLIPLKEVYFLMHDCLAVINPSKFEGWSSSVEEAKSIGKTIILSNLNVHYEQMPPHGTYFPCDDPVWLSDIMKRAWNELKPGPDQIMEEKAGQLLPIRIKQFGKDFQQIVLDALENKNSCEIQMQQAPRITVVTVVSNLLQSDRKKQFIRNLKSVAAQKDVSVEHLIVDCRSTDGTLEFLQPYVQKYDCKLLSSEQDHGIYGAMNYGTIHARGKYVAYLNPDDYYEDTGFLHRSFAALEEGEYDFSYIPDETPVDGMPFRYQSMLFLRMALYSIAVYNDTCRIAGDCDMLLRLILSGKKGIRIDCAAKCAVVAETPRDNGDSAQQEYGLIYSRLCGRLGYELTPEDGRRLYLKKQLPEKLGELLRTYGSQM